MNRKEKQYYIDLLGRLEKKKAAPRGEFCGISSFLKAELVLVPFIFEKQGGVTKKVFTKRLSASKHAVKMTKGAVKQVYDSLKELRRKKKVITVSCGRRSNVLIIPLSASNSVFGAVVAAGLQKSISSDSRYLLETFVATIVRETQREIELSELNETIRPRAIALSTVHTVHRLMSSTLDLNELLLRITRLSLQVIKSYRCSIKLLDKKRKTLLPMTTVDLRKSKARLKKVKIGKYAPGRAVKQYRSIWGKDYLATPLIEGETLGVITLYDKVDGTPFNENDAEIMKTLAEQAVIAIKNAQLYLEQENLTISSIQCLARVLQARPHGGYAAGPSFMKLISLIGKKFNLNETEIKMMQYAAMLHDAGHISIPEKLLLKKGNLTGSEFDLIKKHTLKGADILSKSKPLKPIIPIILYHHENYNGTGYPKGLKGDEIPLQARIIAVVAAFEAMITKKPYRKALSVSAAVEEVKKNSGTQFDPYIVKVFCEAISKKIVIQLLKKEMENAK